MAQKGVNEKELVPERGTCGDTEGVEAPDTDSRGH